MALWMIYRSEKIIFTNRIKLIDLVRCDYKVITKLNLSLQLKDTYRSSVLHSLAVCGTVLGVLVTPLSSSFKNNFGKHNQSHLFPLLYVFWQAWLCVCLHNTWLWINFWLLLNIESIFRVEIFLQTWQRCIHSLKFLKAGILSFLFGALTVPSTLQGWNSSKDF